MAAFFDMCVGTGHMKKIVLMLLWVYVATGKAKMDKYSSSSEENTSYKDTEEIMNEWNNDDSYNYDYSHEVSRHQAEKPTISHLPPVLVGLGVLEVPGVQIPTPTSTTTSTTVAPTTTTTQRPVYFPKTNIELGPLFEQVGKARRNEVEEPVDLPIPYIVWAQDPSGKEDTMNYYKKFYNTMYKVD